MATTSSSESRRARFHHARGRGRRLRPPHSFRKKEESCYWRREIYYLLWQERAAKEELGRRRRIIVREKGPSVRMSGLQDRMSGPSWFSSTIHSIAFWISANWVRQSVKYVKSIFLNSTCLFLCRACVILQNSECIFKKTRVLAVSAQLQT